MSDEWRRSIHKWYQGHCLIPVLLPHLFFKTLHGEKHELFMSSIMGGYENLEFVWASETKRILIKDHPVLRIRHRRFPANNLAYWSP